MSILQAIILAIIEGLTEFLPVSSTGHMIIASSMMGIAQDPFVKTFTIAIQLGAIVSVVILYWKRFLQSLDLYFKLFIAFLPAMVFGFLFNDIIEELLENVLVVATTLVLGGIVLIFVDRWFKDGGQRTDKEMTRFSALKIGMFQVIAMVPGVSRSAATIVGGLTQKLTKKSAAEFSFLLAVPTMFAATAYKLLKFFTEGPGFQEGELTTLLIGNAVAFVVAIIAIRSFISYLTSHGFKIFGYYRIILGLTILILHFIGIELTII